MLSADKQTFENIFNFFSHVETSLCFDTDPSDFFFIILKKKTVKEKWKKGYLKIYVGTSNMYTYCRHYRVATPNAHY